MTTSTETRPISVAMISLGCPKNLVDSERALGTIASGGLAITPEPEGADVAIVTTCGFIDPAKEESIDTILEMVRLKEEGAVRAVVVAGCMVERFAEDLRRELPEVDAFVPFKDYPRLHRLCREVLGETLPEGADHRDDPMTVDRVPLTEAWTAWLKISEGCNNPCSFCTIPAIRGKHVSRPFDALVDDARRLVDEGARELVLIGQDTTYYGYDVDRRFRLAELLRELDAIDGLRWIRLMYAYPAYVRDDLLDAMAECPSVVPYVDMPIQHVADGALRRMMRPLGGARTRDLLHHMKERVPGLAIRTTFIVGSPGETEEEVAELVDFVRDFRFHHVGAFVYSREEDTPMGRRDDPVPAAEANRRRRLVMEAQQKVVLERHRAWVEEGRELEVLVETRASGDRWHGRTVYDAPQVDGTIRLPDGPGTAPGAMGRVRVTKARGYDIEGTWIAPPA